MSNDTGTDGANTQVAVADVASADETAAAAAAAPVIAKLLRKAKFNLATPDGSAVAKPPQFVAAKNLEAESISERRSIIADDYRYDRESGAWKKNVRKLTDDLVLQRTRLQGLLEALDSSDLDAAEMSVSDVRATLEDESTRLREIFVDNMRTVLAEQRPLETNLRSLCEFFDHTGLDGTARSVYLVNHHAGPTPHSQSLDEVSIQEMEADDDTEVHPLFGQVVDQTGERYPVIFRPLDDTDNIKDMASMVVIGGATKARHTLRFWAKRGDQSSFVTIANVDSGIVGRSPQSLAPEVFATKLAGTYNSLDKEYRSLLVAANHSVGRTASEYEDEDVLIAPSHLLAGQLYNQEYNDSRSNVLHGSAVRKDFAPDYGLDSKWIDDQATLLGDVKIAFLRTQDDYRGDGTATSFNALSTAYDGVDTQLNFVMGQNFLGRILRFHMLQHRGGDTTHQEAQRVGKLLHQRLQDLASERDCAKYFVDARCDWKKSHVEEITGEPTQVHEVVVKFREGIRRFMISAARAELGDETQLNEG